jgi:hypothetical protein
MAQATKLTTLLAVLALSACGGGGGDDTTTADTGPDGGGGRQDAGTGMDSGHHGGGDDGGDGATSDAQSGADAGSSVDSGASDAASSDGGLDASSGALAFAQGGHVSVLDGGTSTAQGAALLVRTDAGHTLVSLQVSGLSPDKMYPAHVHNLPCSMQAGGHYQHAADGGVNASNEVWPALLTNDAGQGRSLVDVDRVLRADAISIVVHDPDAANTPKLLCADLSSASLTAFGTSGALTRFGAATDAGAPSLSGNGRLIRASNGTTSASVDLQNLKPNTMYMVHVHDQPCAFASGGGHYKLDYAVDGAVASNELWLDFTSNDAGAGTKDASIDHIARAEAQAIVVHAMDNTRLGCIDLKP